MLQMFSFTCNALFNVFLIHSRRQDRLKLNNKTASLFPSYVLAMKALEAKYCPKSYIRQLLLILKGGERDTDRRTRLFSQTQTTQLVGPPFLGLPGSWISPEIDFWEKMATVEGGIQGTEISLLHNPPPPSPGFPLPNFQVFPYPGLATLALSLHIPGWVLQSA